MDAIVALERLTEADRERAGDKACRLARIAASGFEVAPALCVTTTAYRAFVDANHLRDVIRMELARKPFEDMRWEEIWDAGLRIRGRFLRSPLPAVLREALADAVEERFRGVPVVVRSSAPGEDAAAPPLPGSTTPSSTSREPRRSCATSRWSGPRCGRTAACSTGASSRSTSTRARWR